MLPFLIPCLQLVIIKPFLKFTRGRYDHCKKFETFHFKQSIMGVEIFSKINIDVCQITFIFLVQAPSNIISLVLAWADSKCRSLHGRMTCYENLKFSGRIK